MWSLGTIDFNEIGSYSLTLPYKHSIATITTGVVILRVEIKFATASDMSYINIIVWKEWPQLMSLNDSQSLVRDFTLSLKNDTDYPIVLRSQLRILRISILLAFQPLHHHHHLIVVNFCMH